MSASPEFVEGIALRLKAFALLGERLRQWRSGFKSVPSPVPASYAIEPFLTFSFASRH